MGNKYCIPGTVHDCPYARRCEEEGKYSIVLFKEPLTAFNSKIRKHFTWNSPEREHITCLLRRIIHKDLPELFEASSEYIENAEEIIFTRSKNISK